MAATDGHVLHLWTRQGPDTLTAQAVGERLGAALAGSWVRCAAPGRRVRALPLGDDAQPAHDADLGAPYRTGLELRGADGALAATPTTRIPWHLPTTAPRRGAGC
jgi:hypothetical protein